MGVCPARQEARCAPRQLFVLAAVRRRRARSAYARDVVYFPEGPEGLHDFSNPTDEPVRMLAVSSSDFRCCRVPRAGGRMGGRHPGRRCLKAAKGSHRSVRATAEGQRQLAADPVPLRAKPGFIIFIIFFFEDGQIH